MNTFLVIAAVMAAIAAGAVVLPLVRDPPSRVLAALVALLVVGAAAVLFPCGRTGIGMRRRNRRLSLGRGRPTSLPWWPGWRSVCTTTPMI